MPEDPIAVQKTESEGPSVEKESYRRQRKGRRSIIAEQYLDKVEEARNSVAAEKLKETENTVQSTWQSKSQYPRDDTSSDSQANGATEKKNAPSSPSAGVIFTLEQLQ